MAVLALAAVTGCAEPAPERAVSGFSRDLATGARYAERLAEKQSAAPAAMSDAEVIAAGYLERLRLGIGSPYRLMEYALLDPRLKPGTRVPLVWALLEATRAGRGYEVEPQALTRIAADARSQHAATGLGHLELIERAVLATGDPRAGELAVRGAYRLAAASRSVSPAAPVIAASAAALARDRELARRDAERLLSAAARDGKHPFAVLVEWRKERRFEVEAPPGAPRAPELEEAASRHAVRLVVRVEERRAGSARGTPLPRRRGALPCLAPAVARRLERLADAHLYPTQAPIRITVQRYDEELPRAAAKDPAPARAAGRLLERARSEESLVAGYAALGTRDSPVREAAALLALEAGVAMRAYAQERVWYAGFPAPSDADLKRAFGLRAVKFDPGVPISWRPYYRRMLRDALADLELVLPGLDLRGAAFKIGVTGREVALATHDPQGRTIALPPESGAGTIAHEVGHDLDWQVAHVRYGTRRAYGTEHAVRTGRGDHFAAAVRRMPMPPEIPMRGGSEVQRRYARRPAEVFARTFDGYVAAALAERGRSNGYLSAVQDDFLAGYALALAPGARADADPFMAMLMVASPVPEPERRLFLARWGAGRVPGGFELADRIVADADTRPAPLAKARPAPGMVELLAAGEAVREEAAAVTALRDSALAAWNAARCENPFAAHGPRGEASVRQLADAAAAARIRGIVLARARSFGLTTAPPWLADVWLAAPPALPDPLSPQVRGWRPFDVLDGPEACGTGAEQALPSA